MLTRSRKRWLLAAAVLLLLLTGLGAWYFWPNAQMARVKEMRQQLLGEAGRKLSPSERRQKWEALRKEQEKLSAAQRKQLGEEARKRRRQEVERYSTLSKADKVKWLDEQIDRMEAARRERQAGGGGNGGGRGGAGGGPGQGGAPFANGNWPGGGNLSAADRERLRKERLDSTTPEERAQFDQLRKDMAARRAQRGLSGFAFGPR
jgi:hypothetical protein